MFVKEKPFDNAHVGKIHDLKGGRKVVDVSHGWAKCVDDALARILDASPEIRLVSIELPKTDRDVFRLFHSDDGLIWKQVHLSSFGSRRYDVRWIVRGAQDLDGDPAFTTALTAENLELRELVGRILAPRDRYGHALDEYESLEAWAEDQIRPVLKHAGFLYVEGGGNEEARNGRRHSLLTISRLIQHLRFSLRQDAKFVFPEKSRYNSWIESSFKEFILRRHLPFVIDVSAFQYIFEKMTIADKKRFCKQVWADAARMSSDVRFDAIYGSLLRQAEGHPVYGDAEYKQLEALLAADLLAGYRVVQLDGRLFIHSRGRWHAGRLAPIVDVETDWTRGTIVSRNFGRIIVPPYRREGTLTPGYTRNGPGEGPSEVRKEPVEMKCFNRPIMDTNLNWIHAYHSWELEQVRTK